MCSLTCVELEECVLADGVHLDEKYRVATPPLFVERSPSSDLPRFVTKHDSQLGCLAVR